MSTTAIAQATGTRPEMNEVTAVTALSSGLSFKEASYALYKSGYFKDAATLEKVQAKLIYGRDLGLSVSEAMSGLYIVKERVTMSYTLMGALIKRSGRYDYNVIKHDANECVIEFLKKVEYPHPKTGQMVWEWKSCGQPSRFTMEMAKAAGLTANDTWRKYPMNMLFARALSNGSRFYTPDALGGSPVYLPDEIPGSGVRVDGETGEVIDAEITPTKATQSAPPNHREQLDNLVADLGHDNCASVLEYFKASAWDQLTDEQAKQAVGLLTARQRGTKTTK